jgi:hypothetical protein
MGPKNRLPSLRYFGLPPARPLRLALVDPADRILKGVEARSRRTCSLINNACFPVSSSPSSLLPLPNGRLHHRHGETKSHG